MLSMNWSQSAFLFVIVQIVLAVCVTGHVLLTKRDTSAATGWIGICWLLPVFGSLLYLMFGINRVQRRGQKMLAADTLPLNPELEALRCEPPGPMQPLGHMLDRLTDRQLLRGNSIRCLHNGDQAYPAMLAAIAQAQHSVLLSSYIFRDDRVGQAFIGALAEAHRRGVEVRVLVDGIGSGYFYCPTQRALKRAGVPCARFMHSFWPWRMAFINLRNHRKILVVDGHTGFMGGLNIAAQNVLSQPSAHPVADTHFQLEGPVVEQLADAFTRDWAFTTGEELQGKKFFPPTEIRGEIPARIVTSAPDADMEKIEYTMLQAIILARRNVCFMTPYFIPDGRFATELGLAALRGVRVDIVVPHHSNHPIIDWARNGCLEPLVEVGCHIWLAPPPFNHSKLMVVDGSWSFVGSANLDRRSLRLNFEINMALYDVPLAEGLEAFMASHRGHELTLQELREWSLAERLRNAAVRLLLPYL
ncbi:phospholipase D-like domain-containing protein [Oecophyllibacter saccharovorans]|uniref:phospholipase D-like domain-containing protein n=1 Tax=Oecophyllibacter saccharovorans TaxID=2558360 RepID=UPI001E4D79D8|nr:phospholipase D-like domain-containing protein [Oecophyllibacter saccharovorans]